MAQCEVLRQHISLHSFFVDNIFFSFVIAVSSPTFFFIFPLDDGIVPKYANFCGKLNRYNDKLDKNDYFFAYYVFRGVSLRFVIKYDKFLFY